MFDSSKKRPLFKRLCMYVCMYDYACMCVCMCEGVKPSASGLLIAISRGLSQCMNRNYEHINEELVVAHM